MFLALNKFNCKNCHLDFDAEDAQQCPRCSSTNLMRKAREEVPGEKRELRKPFVFGAPVTDTKESWMKFHNNADTQQACVACGCKDFEFIWKRKEKICKKCGEILPLRRR